MQTLCNYSCYYKTVEMDQLLPYKFQHNFNIQILFPTIHLKISVVKIPSLLTKGSSSDTFLTVQSHAFLLPLLDIVLQQCTRCLYMHGHSKSIKPDHLSPSRKEKGLADVISIHEFLTNQILLINFRQ